MMILHARRSTWTTCWRAVGSTSLDRHLDWGRGHRDDAGRRYLELEQYDRERVHGATIPLPAIAELLHRLAGMTVEEIRALPSMHPGRADVITGGALVESRVAARLNVENLIVSESDILDGIALQLIGDTMPR